MTWVGLDTPMHDRIQFVLDMTLKQARGTRSQRWLAKAAGVDQSIISRIERQETTRPSFDTMKKLAKALGVRVDALSL